MGKFHDKYSLVAVTCAFMQGVGHFLVDFIGVSDDLMLPLRISTDILHFFSLNVIKLILHKLLPVTS